MDEKVNVIRCYLEYANICCFAPPLCDDKSRGPQPACMLPNLEGQAISLQAIYTFQGCFSTIRYFFNFTLTSAAFEASTIEESSYPKVP